MSSKRCAGKQYGYTELRMTVGHDLPANAQYQFSCDSVNQ